MEFKEAKTQFDNHKLYKYCVALANEGGELLLGITNKPPRLARISHTAEIAEIAENFLERSYS